MPGLYMHTTRATGTILTANIYNTDHQNHIDNAVPSMFDDYSANVSEMRTVADPGENGSENLATNIAGELARLRNIIKEISGKSFWYETPIHAVENIPAYMRGYLAGLIISNNGADANNDIDIATGVAVDNSNAVVMTLGSALTKQLDASWAVGTNQGGLDTGAKANSTTYHVFLIRRPDTGVVDALFSVSASAPTMPASYTQKRRIGSIITDGSGNIRAFIQVGDRFDWVISILDVNNALNPGSSAVTRGCTVPTGIVVDAHIVWQVDNSGSGVIPFSWVSPLDCSDEVPMSGVSVSMPAAAGATGRTINNIVPLTIRTNTSGQIRTRLSASDANVGVYMRTRGWTDITRRFA